MKAMVRVVSVFVFLVLSSTTAFSQWIQTNGPYTWTVTSFVASRSYLFAGTDGDGVCRSTNSGASWTPVNSGLTTQWVTSLAVSGSYLFAGTVGGGVFRSTDNGDSWKPFNIGLTNMNVFALSIVGGTNILAGTAYCIGSR